MAAFISVHLVVSRKSLVRVVKLLAPVLLRIELVMLYYMLCIRAI
jgi:hypothetical protein